MKPHIVSQGEDLVSIAQKYQIADWESLYNHTANKRLQRTRPNPFLLYPGDVVYIPESEPIMGKHSTDAVHKMTVTVPKVKIKLKFVEAGEFPLGGKSYELEVQGQKITGSLTGDGVLETQIPVSARTGVLTVIQDPADPDQNQVMNLNFSHQDPIDQVIGLQTVLKNLGFYHGKIDDDYGYFTRKAIIEFQQKNNLPADGELNSTTLVCLTKFC